MHGDGIIYAHNARYVRDSASYVLCPDLSSSVSRTWLDVVIQLLRYTPFNTALRSPGPLLPRLPQPAKNRGREDLAPTITRRGSQCSPATGYLHCCPRPVDSRDGGTNSSRAPCTEFGSAEGSEGLRTCFAADGGPHRASSTRRCVYWEWDRVPPAIQLMLSGGERCLPGAF